MSTQPPLPCRSDFSEHPPSVRILDDRGRVQASATPHFESDDAPARVDSGPGVLDRTASGLDKITKSLARMTTNLWLTRWRKSRGALPDGATATLALPDRSSGKVRNGEPLGDRRAKRTGTIDIYGRRYVVRHVSRRRTEVHRGEQRIATLRRTTWRISNFRADGPPRYSLTPFAVFDIPDMLAIQVTASLLGPPGRTGWISRNFSSILP